MASACGKNWDEILFISINIWWSLFAVLSLGLGFIIPYAWSLMVDPTVSKTLKPVVPIPGSILKTALSAGIDMDHSCGGVCACSTCHIIVRQGLDSCNDATDDEEDMLDLAPGLEPQSRLACQCVPDGSKDIIVEIPEWNRNLVSETH